MKLLKHDLFYPDQVGIKIAGSFKPLIVGDHYIRLGFFDSTLNSSVLTC